MPRYLLSVILIALLAGFTRADELFSRRIIPPASPGKKLGPAIDDLKMHLERMTGEAFAVAAGDKGIVVAAVGQLDSPPAVATRLKGKDPETLLIHRDGDRLYLLGNTEAGAVHAIYHYLEGLGCRWLYPTEAWTIVPQTRDLAPAPGGTIIETPAFNIRGAFATGGFGGNLPLDPTRSMQAKWNLWYQRLRYGGLIHLAGHAGEDFVSRNRKTLEEHPEYLAEINGQRSKLEAGTKPCYSNPDAVALYVKDRLAKLETAIKADPDSPAARAVSVDPSDGGGHCECAGCVKLGSVSNRVFTLANAVARAVQESFPGRLVNLYAYNEHAAPPTIDLEPNVYVMLVPYGLQRTGLHPEAFIEAWANKTPHMGVYGYWALTDWSNDLPDLDYNRTVAAQIRSWHRHGLTGASLQSTAASGSIGLPLYLAGKLLWQPGIDVDAVIDDFIKHAFGPAAPPMKRMLARWGDDFALTEQELALAYRDLDEAGKLTTDAAITARLDDLRRYVHYLRLWYQYDLTPGKSPQRSDATEHLIQYLWRIYDSSMVHVYRMHVLLVNRYERAEKQHAERWPLKGDAEIWKTVAPIGHDELLSLMQEGAKQYPVLRFERRSFSDELVPSVPQPKGSGKTVSTTRFGASMTFMFQVAPGRKQVAIEISVGRSAKEYPGDLVTVRNEKGEEVFRQLVPPGSDGYMLNIPTATPGRYAMHVSDQKAMYVLKVPDDLPFTVSGPMMSADVMRKMYFHVPRGTQTLAIYSQSVVPVKVWNADGQEMEVKGNRLLLVDVPRGQDGRTWSFGNFKSWVPLKMLSVPNAFSLTAETLMIPKELASSR